MSLGSEGHFAPPSGAESFCQCRRRERSRFDPWIGTIPWRRKWQPTPVFLTWQIPWTEEPGGLQSMGSHTHTHTQTHTRHEEPPSCMPDLVIPIPSFQEKHHLGERWAFFSPTVLCISQPWFCCFEISPLPGGGVSSYLDVP